MITIQVKANTENAFNGLKNHFKESNKFRNKVTLKAHGVTQELLFKDHSLKISWANLLNKISSKLKTDFQTMIKEDQKQDFQKHVDNFMKKQKVEKYEYEVLFNER